MRGLLAIVATFVAAGCGHHDAAAPTSGSAAKPDVYKVEIDVTDAAAAAPPTAPDPGAPATGTAAATVPAGRVLITEKRALDDTTLSADDVLQKFMSAYLPAVSGCYQQTLARDATARGKLQIAFTVADSGRVTKANVSGFDEQLDACVKDTSPGWAFVRPKDKAGKPTSAGFQLTLQLVPS